jgi:HK97 family phage prohead protease
MTARSERAALFTPDTYDSQSRTVEVVMSTGSPVKRWFGIERLGMMPENIDLARVVSGAVPVLLDHASSVDNQVGSIVEAVTDGTTLVGRIRFHDTERAKEIEARVARGELKTVSVGYIPHQWTAVFDDEGDGEDEYTATRWELLELSFTPTPADRDAMVRGLSPHVVMEAKVSIENTTEIATKRAATLTRLGANLGVAAEQVAVAIEANEAIDVVSLRWSQEAAERTRAVNPPIPAGSAAVVTVDETDKRREAGSIALLHRIKPAPRSEMQGNPFAGQSIIQMMARMTGSDMSIGKSQIFARAMHSTSDFPFILANVANKRLMAAYTETGRTFTAWARNAPPLPDFKQRSVVTLGAFANLVLKEEGANFTQGTVGEAREVYNLATYGREVSFTREMAINDDLNAFDRLITLAGQAAARVEGDLVYATLTGSQVMGDGVELFHSTHLNLGTAGAPSETTLGEADQLMREQTGLAGERLGFVGQYLVVPPKYRAAALRSVAAITPVKSTEVNPFANNYEVIVEPRLRVASNNQPWYLIAGAGAETVEYSYLDEAQGPQIMSKVDEGVGTTVRVFLDFAAKAVDWRGMVKNPAT